MRAELQTARELGEQLLSLARRIQDPALLLEAHRALGATLYFLGEFAPAQAHFEQCMALYDPQQHRSHAFLYGFDPRVACLCYEIWILWLLGYPDRALQRDREALTLARELAHPFSLAFALQWTGMLHQCRREGQAVQRWAEAEVTLATEQVFPVYLSVGTILQGWALAEQGQGEEGIAQIRQGWAAWQATGAELWRPHWLALLAEAYGKVGQTDNTQPPSGGGSRSAFSQGY